MRDAAGKLDIDQDMLRRGVNVGFSGGEKKRNEILQMALLEPRLAVLDETDSGLDIDALKIVADGVNRLRSPERAFVVITHYQRLLDYIVPDVVHVLSKGRIVRPAARSWRSSSKPRATRNIRTRRREHERRSPRRSRPRPRQALSDGLRGGEGHAAGRARSRRCAKPRSRASRRAACRTAGSRNGNTPTCAR